MSRWVTQRETRRKKTQGHSSKILNKAYHQNLKRKSIEKSIFRKISKKDNPSWTISLKIEKKKFSKPKKKSKNVSITSNTEQTLNLWKKDTHNSFLHNIVT